MKANELMIRDWVLYNGNPHYVIAIESDGMVKITTPDKSDEWCRATWPDRFEPVPLTPEILEKNGFVYSDLPFEQSWQQYGLSIYGTTGNYHINCGMNVSMDVSNVHELQHALRLCKIDKTIIL